jgi:hypothetical protein
MLFGAILMLVGGCGDDSGTNPIPTDATLQQFTVDQSGGTVEYRSPEQDVSLTLTFPPGALNNSTVITIQHARDFPSTAGLVAGAVFDFGPQGLMFNTPVELRIAYSAGMIGGLTEDDLRIHKADGSNWVPILGSVDTASNIVSAMLDGFSIFGLKTIPTGSPPPPGSPRHRRDHRHRPAATPMPR